MTTMTQSFDLTKATLLDGAVSQNIEFYFGIPDFHSLPHDLTTFSLLAYNTRHNHCEATHLFSTTSSFT